MQDVGKPKAEVAAERVMQRVKGVTVVPHFCRIEEKDVSFYQDFQIIVLGLDSLEARSYINSVVCGFLGQTLFLCNLIRHQYVSLDNFLLCFSIMLQFTEVGYLLSVATYMMICPF